MWKSLAHFFFSNFQAKQHKQHKQPSFTHCNHNIIVAWIITQKHKRHWARQNSFISPSLSAACVAHVSVLYSPEFFYLLNQNETWSLNYKKRFRKMFRTVDEMLHHFCYWIYTHGWYWPIYAAPCSSLVYCGNHIFPFTILHHNCIVWEKHIRGKV